MRSVGEEFTMRASVNIRAVVKPPGGADAVARIIALCAASNASMGQSSVGWRSSWTVSASLMSSMSAMMTASLVAK